MARLQTRPQPIGRRAQLLGCITHHGGFQGLRYRLKDTALCLPSKHRKVALRQPAGTAHTAQANPCLGGRCKPVQRRNQQGHKLTHIRRINHGNTSGLVVRQTHKTFSPCTEDHQTVGSTQRHQSMAQGLRIGDRNHQIIKPAGALKATCQLDRLARIRTQIHTQGATLRAILNLQVMDTSRDLKDLHRKRPQRHAIQPSLCASKCATHR